MYFYAILCFFPSLGKYYSQFYNLVPIRLLNILVPPGLSQAFHAGGVYERRQFPPRRKARLPRHGDISLLALKPPPGASSAVWVCQTLSVCRRQRYRVSVAEYFLCPVFSSIPRQWKHRRLRYFCFRHQVSYNGGAVTAHVLKAQRG